tara:strand:+ start:2086 stop:2751 length:666 start_codon:yes stop_codon:yes gene_type:complete
LLKTTIYGKNEIFVDTSDVRGQWIIDQKGTQKEKITLLKKVCIANNVDIFVDIGANYGEFSVALSEKVNEVHSFEPNPTVFKCLKETVKLYDNMNIYQKAVMDVEGVADFYLHKKYSGGGRLSPWTWNENNRKENYEKVKVSTCDILDILSNLEIQPKCILLKMDTEGSEIKLINYLKDYLMATDKWFIFFEKNKITPSQRKNLPGRILIDMQHDMLIGKI